jgi:hypothetical protein
MNPPVSKKAIFATTKCGEPLSLSPAVNGPQTSAVRAPKATTTAAPHTSRLHRLPLATRMAFARRTMRSSRKQNGLVARRRNLQRSVEKAGGPASRSETGHRVLGARARYADSGNPRYQRMGLLVPPVSESTHITL